MINANELRIGNWIADYEADSSSVGHFQVEQLTKYVGSEIWIVYRNNSIKSKEVSPIELTEEILLKCGFIQSKNNYGNTFHVLDENGFTAMFTVEHWTKTEENSKWKNNWHTTGLLKGNKLKYLHQLQNLYWCLTNEELIYTP
jgi:hypothetical protein